MRGSWWVSVVVLVVGLVLLPSVLHADGGRSTARRAYQEGKRHYDVGEYAEALTAFKRAYLAHEDPVLLYNIAQCHRLLGNTTEALTAYRSYLRKLPDAPNRVEVETQIGKLETPVPPPDPTPPPVAVPPPVEPTAAVTLTEVAPPPRKTPVYKKWWLWTIVGGVAVAGVAVGLGVGLTHRPTEPTLPNVVVP